LDDLIFIAGQGKPPIPQATSMTSVLQKFEESIMSLPPGTLGDVRPQELDDVVDLHLRAFPATFITPLGRPLVRLYYLAALSCPGAVFLAYRGDASRIVGFVMGVRSASQFHRHLLLRHGWQAAAAAVRCPLWAVTNVLRRLARRLVASKSRGYGVHADAECMSMAVDPTVHDPSIAASLTAAFIRRMRSQGVATILSGIRVDNPRLLRFARMFGYRDVGRDVRPDGYDMQILLWSQDQKEVI
jgi:ribosomal protein S18 acetylase RimI-like enzyme